MLLILDFKVFQSVIFIIQQSEIVLQEKKRKHATELECTTCTSNGNKSTKNSEKQTAKAFNCKDIYDHCACVVNTQFREGIKHKIHIKK